MPRIVRVLSVPPITPTSSCNLRGALLLPGDQEQSLSGLRRFIRTRAVVDLRSKKYSEMIPGVPSCLFMH